MNRPRETPSGDEEFMREAVRLAVESVRSRTGGPFGAVVVRDGRIIGRGMNLVTSSNDPTAHAEVVAIREACRELESFQLADCDVYCSSEPCPMCMAALYWARPRRVFYANDKHRTAVAGFDDERIYEQLARPLGERALELRRLPVEELDLWEETEDKIAY